MSDLTIKNKPYLELNITKHYKNYKDFYDENKYDIYQSIVSLYDGFTKNKNKKLVLYISVKINNVFKESKFVYYRMEYSKLKNELLPFFENLEDYETCEKIINIYNKIDQKHKKSMTEVLTKN